MTDVETVVVGLGAMGSATAWHLARRGVEVVGLDAHPAGHERGSSHGATRIFRLAYHDRDYVALARRALAAWHDLEAWSGVTLLETTGGIDHGDPAQVTRIADALAAERVPHEVVDGAVAMARHPGLRVDGPAVLQPDAGRVWAERTLAALQHGAVGAGAVLRHTTPVEAIEARDDCATVHLDGEVIRARTVVCAAGAWTSALLGGVVSLPTLSVTQEQAFHFAPRDPALAWPSTLVWHEPVLYSLATPSVGVKVAEHHTGAVADPDRRSGVVDATTRDRLCRAVAEWFPGLHPEPVESTTCLYTSTVDQDFVLDRRGPLVVVSTCSGHGFKFTPLVGALAAALATGDPARSPDRFRLPVG